MKSKDENLVRMMDRWCYNNGRVNSCDIGGDENSGYDKGGDDDAVVVVRLIMMIVLLMVRMIMVV